MCGQIGQNEPRPPVSNAICAVPAGRRSTAPFASLSLKNKSIFGPPMASACALPRTGVLRHDGFRRYWIARFLGSFSAQIMGMSAGWQIYDITHDPSALGMVGLTLFLPVFLLVLLTGAIADKFNRVRIMTTCIVGEGLCALAFLTFTIIGAQSAVLIFCTLVVLGTLRAFFGPAQQSLMPASCRKKNCQAPSPGVRRLGRLPPCSARLLAVCFTASLQRWPTSSPLCCLPPLRSWPYACRHPPIWERKNQV